MVVGKRGIGGAGAEGKLGLGFARPGGCAAWATVALGG